MATNTQFLFGIIVFYGILAVTLSLYGNSLYDIEGGTSEAISNIENQKADAGFWESIWINISIFSLKAFSFLIPIYIGISALPSWFNIILFTPLLIITVWTIVITLVPFFNDA